MQGSVRIGRVLGVQIGLHYSWFLVFAFVTWSLGAVYFPGMYPSWARETAWAAGIVTSILFFASVLVHELAHSVVAQRLGLQVESITLFVFGGMASIAREAERARDEFAIAFAGPASSVLLGILFGALGLLTSSGGASMQPISSVAWWLATINIMLGAFNLIPGFPMDGGRVLRSFIWGLTRKFWLATKIAALVGLLIAYGMMLVGVYLAVNGSLANAAWTIFVGWFLSSAASSSYRQAKMRESLSGVTVGQAMQREYEPVRPSATLTEAFEAFVGRRRTTPVPVMSDDSNVLGVLTEASFRRVPRDRWQYTPVTEAMTTEPAAAVSPTDQVNDVLTTLSGKEFAAAPVVEEGRVVGILTPAGIVDLVRHRRRLDSAA